MIIPNKLTQQSDKLQFIDVKVIRRTGILQPHGRWAHLYFGHMRVTSIKHHAFEAGLTVFGVWERKAYIFSLQQITDNSAPPPPHKLTIPLCNAPRPSLRWGSAY